MYMQSNQSRREKRKCSKSTHFNTNLFFQQQQQKENTKEMGMELFSISHFPKPVISFKEKKEVDIQIFIEIFFSEERKKGGGKNGRSKNHSSHWEERFCIYFFKFDHFL